MKTLHTIYSTFAKHNMAKFLTVLTMLLIVGIGQAWGAEVFNITSYTSFPTGWTNNSVSTGSYFKFDSDGCYLITSTYDPHTDLTLTYKVATYGSGTNHPLTIQLLDENGNVKQTHTTGTPTSSTYITGTWSIGTVNYKFKIKFYLAETGKGVRLQVPKLVGDPATSTEPYTVTFHTTATEETELTEESAGAGVTPPTMEEECGDWTFQGWSESFSVSETSTTKLDLVTLDDGIYYPTKDIDFYPVYTKSEGGGGSTEETLSQTLQYDTWSYSGSTTDKSSYRLFHSGSYVESSEFDLSTLSKVVVYGGTFGGSSYNKLTIAGVVGTTTTTWKSVTVSGSSQTGTNTYTDGTSLSGIGKLRVTSNSGSSSSSGVRISKIMIYTLQATSTTYYYSYPECTTQTVPSLSVSGVSESSLAFGNVTVNSPQPLTFTLSGSNLTADATLALSGTNAGLFSVSPTSVTPSNGSITSRIITVTYTPDAKASHSAILTISSTDAESIEIQLSGTGVAQMADYTVNHYQQNITDDNYTLKETETPSGEVGASVTPDVKTYTGFKAPSTQTVTIKADGKTVVEYYYTRNSYTLTWDVNEGNDLTGEYTSGSVKFGATITKPADPTRAGYNFSGWHNGTAIVTPATTMPADNLIYTAQWKETYTVTWLVEGQPYTIGNPTTTVEEGQNITAIPFDPPLLTCAVKFMGWSIESSGSTPEDPSYYSDLFTTLDEAKVIPIEENTIFHAVFAMTQSGTQSETITTEKSSFTATSGTLDDNISYNSYTGDAGNAPALSNGAIRLYQVSSDTKTGGYIVISAATGSITSASITSTETYASSYTGYILDYTKTYTPDKDDFEVNDYTLYKGQTYTVSGINNKAIAFACFSTNSNYRLEIAKISVTYTKEGAPSYTDYITSCCETPAPTNGAYENITGSDNAMSVTLTWEGSASRYHITGGNLNAEGEYTDQTSHTISGLTECNEYIFYVSAYPADGCESSAIEIGVTPYIQKIVTFDDGTTTTTQSTSCDNKTVTVPTPTAQNCFTYVWKDEQDNKYDAGQVITPEADMTITAHWSVIPYTITFVDYDGTQLQQSTVNCGETPTPPDNPTRESDNTYTYTFASWTPTIVPANGDATYTATYTQTQHPITITWMVNNEAYTVGEPSTTVLAGEKVAKLPTPPNPDDYCGQVFAGWTDEPIDEVNDNIPSILFTTPDASPTIFKEDDNATITFYAVFANIVE